MKQKILTELKSTIITFVAMFVLTILYQLQGGIDNFNFLDNAAWVSLITAGFRTAVKAILPILIMIVKGILDFAKSMWK